MTGEPMSAERMVGGYDVLFPPLVCTAHRACLEHARLTREEAWPTIESCLALATPYGVPGAELAAFFGYLSYREAGRTIWVDAMRGPIPSWTARRQSTRKQAIAYGFLCAFTETVAEEVAH